MKDIFCVLLTYYILKKLKFQDTEQRYYWLSIYTAFAFAINFKASGFNIIQFFLHILSNTFF